MTRLATGLLAVAAIVGLGWFLARPAPPASAVTPAANGDISPETPAADPPAVTAVAAAPYHSGVEDTAAAAGARATLALEVEDPDGRRQAGVPVALFLVSKAQVVVAWRGETGTNGVAVCPRPSLFAEAARDGVRLEAGLLVPFPSPRLETVDPRSTTARRLKLVLPPTGRFAVVLKGEDGEPVRESASVGLSISGDSGRIEGHPFPETVREVRDGAASWEHVGPGLRFLVRVRSSERPPAETEDDGPHVAGERRRTHVTVRAGHPSVTIRLLDADRAPVAGTTVSTVVEISDGKRTRVATDRPRTDGEGRIRLPLRDAWSAGERRVLVVRDEHRGKLEVDLSREFPAGVTDLGDSAFDGGDPLASGIVVDGAGAPLAGAVVAVTATRAAEPAARHELAAVTGADGLFAIRDAARFDAVEVAVSLRDHLAPPRRKERPGVAGLRFTLRRPGSIAGRILFDEGTPITEIGMRISRIEPPVSGAPLPPCPVTPPDAEGRFELKSIEPGTCDLEVAISGDSGPVWTAAGVRIPEGGPAADPRLAAIDLRGRLRKVVVHVTGQEGRPVQNATVAVAGRPDAWISRARFEAKGPWTLLTTAASIEIEVRAPEHRTERLRTEAAECTVRLRPRIRLHVALSPEVMVPDPACRFRLHHRFRPAAEAPVPAAGPRGESAISAGEGFSLGLVGDGLVRNDFGNRREIDVELAESGRYELGLSLSRDGKKWVRLRAVVPSHVDVPDAETASVTLSASFEDLDRAFLDLPR